jgi:hypothetical protein
MAFCLSRMMSSRCSRMNAWVASGIVMSQAPHTTNSGVPPSVASRERAPGDAHARRKEVRPP